MTYSASALPAKPSEFGRELAIVDDALAAMAVAESMTSAVRERQVNLGVVQDEYLDYIRRGRR